MKRAKQNRKEYGNIYFHALIFSVIVIADAITKHIVFSSNASRDFGIFAIRLVTNTGASFGILKGMNLAFIILYLAVIALAATQIKRFSEKERYFIAAILGGIVGNLIDRVFRGFVVDFIDFKFWPVFNIADTAIFISVIGMIIFLIKKEKDSA